jgi:hypothetical protein
MYVLKCNILRAEKYLKISNPNSYLVKTMENFKLQQLTSTHDPLWPLYLFIFDIVDDYGFTAEV